MRQSKKESFSSFYLRFERELADAGVVSSLDAVKIGYLKAAINETLSKGIVSLNADFTEFAKYVSGLYTVSGQLESIRTAKNVPAPRQPARNNSGHNAAELIDWKPAVR